MRIGRQWTSISVVLWTVCLVLLIIASTANCELHRAKTLNSKSHHPGRTAILKNKLDRAQQCDFAGSLNVTQDSLWFKSIAYGDRWVIWIYSLVSAGLVGLSGIFPLLVIPLEAGEALTKGGELRVFGLLTVLSEAVLLRYDR